LCVDAETLKESCCREGWRCIGGFDFLEAKVLSTSLKLDALVSRAEESVVAHAFEPARQDVQ
jgi:hypothetical protein